MQLKWGNCDRKQGMAFMGAAYQTIRAAMLTGPLMGLAGKPGRPG